MMERERYPARWTSQKQGRLVCAGLAGALVIDISGFLLGWNPAAWDFSTAFGGVGAGAIYWVTEVLM
jgi:hypothetical protein